MRIMKDNKMTREKMDYLRLIHHFTGESKSDIDTVLNLLYHAGRYGLKATELRQITGWPYRHRCTSALSNVKKAAHVVYFIPSGDKKICGKYYHAGVE